MINFGKVKNNMIVAALIRKPYYVLFVTFLLCLFDKTSSQNLVPNPSFELYEACPPYPGQIHLAQGWDSPNNRTTDYFHRCSPAENGASVPENLVGIQEPFHGNAYTGIRTWIPIIPGNFIYREYLATQLLEPLKEGQEYEISFRVSVAELSGYYSNDLGLYLSADPFVYEVFYEFQPQLSYQSENVLDNTEEWQKISTIYSAKGGEQYLILGNFLSDEEMTREEVDAENPVVYYYIDEVAVIPCAAFEDQTIVVDTVLCEGQPMLLAGAPAADNHFWSNGSGSVEQVITEPGKYEVISDFGCYRVQTLYEVLEKDCTCQIRIPSPQGISTSNKLSLPEVVEDYRVLLFNASGQFVHQLHYPDQTLPLLPSGIYYWTAHLKCSGNETKNVSGRILYVH